MIIIKGADTDKRYAVSICNCQYTVSANTEQEAADIVADYLEKHNLSDFYADGDTIRVLAKYSEHNTEEMFAKANGLTRCANGIYLEISKVEEL